MLWCQKSTFLIKTGEREYEIQNMRKSCRKPVGFRQQIISDAWIILNWCQTGVKTEGRKPRKAGKMRFQKFNGRYCRGISAHVGEKHRRIHANAAVLVYFPEANPLESCAHITTNNRCRRVFCVRDSLRAFVFQRMGLRRR